VNLPGRFAFGGVTQKTRKYSKLVEANMVFLLWPEKWPEKWPEMLCHYQQKTCYQVA